MRKVLWIFSLSFIFIFGCSESGEELIEEDRLKAPDFKLVTLSGESYQLSDMKGKVVVLYFFLSTNCLSCLAAMPDIESDLVKPFENNKDVIVLALDVADGNANIIQYFKDFTGVTFPVLMNASEVANSYQTTFDRLVIIDKAGKIRYKGSRPVINETAAANQTINQYLN